MEMPVLWSLTFLVHLTGCAFVLARCSWAWRSHSGQMLWSLFLAIMLSTLARRCVWLIDMPQRYTSSLHELLWDFGNSALFCAFAYIFWRFLQPNTSLLAIPAALITIDSDSRVLAWDERATQLFGYTAAEMLGTDLSTIIMDPAYAARHKEALAQWVTSPAPERLRDPYLTYAMDRYGNHFRVSVTIRSVQRGDGTWEFHGAVRCLVEL